MMAMPFCHCRLSLQTKDIHYGGDDDDDTADTAAAAATDDVAADDDNDVNAERVGLVVGYIIYYMHLRLRIPAIEFKVIKLTYKMASLFEFLCGFLPHISTGL